MKIFIARLPLAFSLLLTVALFGLAFISTVAIPRTVISSVENLPPELKLPPTDQRQALTVLVSPVTLFQVLAALLAVVLLRWLGWWREVGFNRPSRWRNPHLLWFPLFVGALALLGGVRVSGPAFFTALLLAVFVAAFSEEVLYRGIIWRALVPTGLRRAVVTTTLLSSMLYFGTFMLAGPWPEAILLTILATCRVFAYAALRWRTASIWPAILSHFLFSFVSSISTPETVPYLVPILNIANTVGFVTYGLFLLRNRRVRADGG